MEPPGFKIGRPSKPFLGKCLRARHSEVASLVDANKSTKLVLAMQVNFYKTGKRDAAKMLGELGSTLSRANQIKKLAFNPPNDLIPYTPDEALALYVDGGFTKASHTLILLDAKTYRANIYPCHPSCKEEMLSKQTHFGIRNICRNSFTKFNQSYSFKVV